MRKENIARPGRPQVNLPEHLDSVTIDYLSWLRTTRREAAVTLDDAAKRTSVSRETLRRLEAGMITPISRRHAREHAKGIGLDPAMADAEHAKYVARRIRFGLGVLAAILGAATAAAAAFAVVTSIGWPPAAPLHQPVTLPLRELSYEIDPKVTEKWTVTPGISAVDRPGQITIKPGCVVGDEIRVDLDHPVAPEQFWDDDIVIAEMPTATLQMDVRTDPLLTAQSTEDEHYVSLEVWGDGRLLRDWRFNPSVGVTVPLRARIDGAHRLRIIARIDRGTTSRDCQPGSTLTLQNSMIEVSCVLPADQSGIKRRC